MKTPCQYMRVPGAKVHHDLVDKGSRTACGILTAATDHYSDVQALLRGGGLMTRPCPWCHEEQPLVPSISGMTWAPSAKLHMWSCQFEDVPAAPAGTGGPVSAPPTALRSASFPGRTTTSIFRRLFAREGGEGRRRNNPQGDTA